MDEGRYPVPLTRETLTIIENAIATAKENGEATILFDGREIDLTEAEEVVRIANEQFADQDKPHPDAEKRQEKTVLLIKENIFEDEFSVYSDIGNVTSTFIPVDTFNPEFQLKEYQETGIGWLQYLYTKDASGAVLADDMGLGKTLQVLYFLEWVAGLERNPEAENVLSLLVLPTAVLENWEEEYARFFPNSRMIVLRLGNQGSTTVNDLVEGYTDYQAPVLVITSYETIRSHQKKLAVIPWTIIVADEAQKIKNPSTKLTNAVKALKSQFALAITGTPVENSFFDLWCIFDFVSAGLLGTMSAFGDEFGIKRNAAVKDPVEVGQAIRQRIGGHLLRRRKEDVLTELPRKFDSIQHADHDPFRHLNLAREMPAAQLEAYRKSISQPLVPQEGTKKGNEAMQRILAIRRVSDHPFLYRDDLFRFSSDELIATSARLMATIEVLKHVQSRGERVIIFAEFKKTQRLLASVIKDKFSVRAPIINGDTPVISSQGTDSRQRTISQFNKENGFGVIVMSPIAAGVGLNVTGANHVIHYSRHWNPARENQATDRAYRIGQTKPVYVYYPQAISSEGNTFDVVINELLQQKTNIASATLYPTEAIEIKPTELLERLNVAV